MRIIAGQRRGLILSNFDADFVRPTKDIVKEFIYNCLANVKDISQCSVCDLFAGTGSLGIEAMSRGSSNVTFVEVDPHAVSIIHKNIEKTKLKTGALVVQTEALGFLKQNQNFDIIIADPPYDQRLGNTVIETIVSFNCLNAEGILVIETAPDETYRPFDTFKDLSLYKQKKWGESFVTILQKNV